MRREFLNDEEAVSVAVGFILTFTITVIAFMMVMSSFYGLMDSTEHNVMLEECEIHGNDIALQIINIDAAVNVNSVAGGSISELNHEIDLPDRIAGQYYSIEFSNTTNEITFRSQKSDRVLTRIEYVTKTTDVKPTIIHSAAGEHYMEYNPATNLIEIY